MAEHTCISFSYLFFFFVGANPPPPPPYRTKDVAVRIDV